MNRYEVIGLIMVTAGILIVVVSGILMDTSAPLPATDWEVTSRNVVPENPTAIGVPIGGVVFLVGTIVFMIGRYGIDE